MSRVAVFVDYQNMYHGACGEGRARHEQFGRRPCLRIDWMQESASGPSPDAVQSVGITVLTRISWTRMPIGSVTV